MTDYNDQGDHSDHSGRSARDATSDHTDYALKHPVELRNTSGDVIDRITELKLRRLKGKDMRDITNAMAKGHGEMIAVLICRCAGIPPSTFDQLDAEDITAVGEVATGFIGGALPTGAQ